MSGPKRVLIVEDESLIAMALAAYLQREGYAVLELSATGEEAVKKSREERPDIIIMDIRLAGEMDGIEAAEIISRERNVFIIFMTGYSARAPEERVAVLTKPIDFSALRGILSRIG
jgi:CheY-like chemotaxis protein